MQPLHLFIYGSLMRGEANHRWLDTATWLRDARTEPRYSLHWTQLGPFPGMLAGGYTAVRGEVYAVTAEHLTILDDFEQHPTLYERRLVAMAELSSLRHVQAYFLVNPEHAAERMENGDWRRRQR